jgi:hypothetical protein
MKAAAVILLVLSAAWVAAPGIVAQRRAPGLRVRGRGQTLLLSERGRTHTLRVADKVDAARITDASVIFESRAGEFLYLLLDVCGPSKAQPDDRQCGAGVECNLLWLKLDARRGVADSNSARYESCWAPITSDEGYRVNGRTLRATVNDFREQLEYYITYDADRPEQGLQTRQSPLKSSDGKNK